MLILHRSSLIFAFHAGHPHNWSDLVRSWSFEPVVLIGLIASGGLFAIGLVRLRREAPKLSSIRTWEALCFTGGWLSLWLALVSPLHAWGQVLFSAHMTQHEVLMLVAAPLLVLGRPLLPLMWALPLKWSRALGRFSKMPAVHTTWRLITIPLVAWIVHAIALWCWHIPSLFEAVLHNEWVHTAQHLSFLISALIFWWALIHGSRGAMGYGAAVLYVFTTSIHSGVLGALITFAASAWYPSYVGRTASWGLTPLEDQQLGGLIMWIPAGVVYIIAGLALFVGWMRESERRVIRRERDIPLRAAKVVESEINKNGELAENAEA